MSLKGKIISLHDNGLRAKVLVKPVPDCHGCQACAGIIKMSKAANRESEIEALTNNFSVHEGDTVKLELTEYQGSKIALIIYGIPIICFIIGMLLTPYICNLIKIPITDLARIIGAFSGLFISFAFIFISLKRSKKDSFIMSISEIISDK